MYLYTCNILHKTISTCMSHVSFKGHSVCAVRSVNVIHVFVEGMFCSLLGTPLLHLFQVILCDDVTERFTTSGVYLTDAVPYSNITHCRPVIYYIRPFVLVCTCVVCACVLLCVVCVYCTFCGVCVLYLVWCVCVFYLVWCVCVLPCVVCVCSTLCGVCLIHTM